MANNLSDIVTVNISIAQPAVDSASFDNLLIVGPPPSVEPMEPLPVVGVYSDLSEVVDAGFSTTGDGADPVGVAARIAFSQSPRTGRLFIATQKVAQPLITGGDTKIITADNALTDAIPIGTIDGATAINLPWLQITYSRTDLTAMEVEIVKDGISRYGKSLPTTANDEAFLQVCIGTSPIPTDDMMGVVPGEEDGTYVVTLTATRGQRKTVMTRTVIFDGTNFFPDDENSGDETTPHLQTPVELLNEAVDTTGWYVVCPAGIDESQFEEIAEWTEAQTKLFAYTFLSKTDPVGAIFYRSHGWCGLITDSQDPADVPDANRYLHVGATAKALAFPAGAESWAFKQLASLYPSTMSSTLRKALAEGHSNFFTQYAGRNVTMNGQVRSGEWIDVIRGRDWLQNDMQLRIFNLLLVEPKIFYTNSGITKVDNQMKASLKAGQERGIVAEDEFDEDGNLVPGFTTSVPNALSLTATQRASRILEDCKFSARIANAIHAVRVDGSMTH